MGSMGVRVLGLRWSSVSLLLVSSGGFSSWPYLWDVPVRHGLVLVGVFAWCGLGVVLPCS